LEAEVEPSFDKAYSQVDSEPVIFPLATTLEDLADVSLIVAGVATFFLFLAAIWAGRTAEKSLKEAGRGVEVQIEHQRTIDERRRAYDHLAILNSREFTEMTAEALSAFQRFTEEGASEETWAKVPTAGKVATQTVLNFYEEIATEYNAGFLDRQAARPLVFVAVGIWREGEKLIEWIRETDDRYLSELASLHEIAAPEFTK
jgi:hypothetical protein